MAMEGKHLLIAFSSGGLGDCAKHALHAGLEKPKEIVRFITVLTQFPEMLEEKNWKCGCEFEHGGYDPERFKVVKVNSWKEDLSQHFVGVDAVITGLGNRQAFHGDYVSAEGNKAIIKAMNASNVKRLVAISSTGVAEDWPSMEFEPMFKSFMKFYFRTIARWPFLDLTKGDKLIKESSNIDYHIVRPVGVPEDIKPLNEYYLQKEKYKDQVGAVMAKLDVGRYLVKEAIDPTRFRDAVVIGSEPGTMPFPPYSKKQA